MSEQKEKACCFTGHRASKLPFIENDKHPDTIQLKEALMIEIAGLVATGCRDFYIGCSEGFDIIFGELVLEAAALLEEPLRLICVLPYTGYGKGLREPWRTRCLKLKASAAEVIELAEKSSKSSYLARNRYMVEHASALVAVYQGIPSGTAYTIRYAAKQHSFISIFSIQNGQVWRSTPLIHDWITNSTGQ